VLAAIGHADAVLVPGFPLDQPDHAWVTDLLLQGALPEIRVGLYVEQPYAALRLMGRGRRTWTGELSTSQGLRNSMRIAVGAGAALQRPDAGAALGMAGRAPAWGAVRVDGAARRAKQRALRAYRSQVPNFGPLVLSRMALYEKGWGGEGLAWLD
jgi:hypothetical protein